MLGSDVITENGRERVKFFSGQDAFLPFHNHHIAPPSPSFCSLFELSILKMSLKRKLSFGATCHVVSASRFYPSSNDVRTDIDTMAMDVDWQSNPTISTDFIDCQMDDDGGGDERLFTSSLLSSWSAGSMARLDMTGNRQQVIVPVDESGRTRKRLRNMRPSEEVISGTSVS